MIRPTLLGFALAAALGCAAGGESTRAPEPEPSVPLCAPIATLAPLPEPGACGDGELAEYQASLTERVTPHAKRVLVRAELDDESRVASLCVGAGPGYGPGRARRALSEHLEAIRALPPGPACLAGKRLDLNRYEAKWAEIHERETRCGEQTRVTRESQGPTMVRERATGGHYGIYDREYQRCMEYRADWILLEPLGSTRPAIWVKPEVPDPPGPDAYETASRCTRLSSVFEKRAACIEADGWERLEPPR